MSKKLLVLIGIVVSCLQAKCQNNFDTSNLFGTWMLERIDFLDNSMDSAAIKIAFEGHIFTVDKNGQYSSRKLKDGKEIPVRKGILRWTKIPFIEQDGTEIEVVQLTSTLLSFNIDDELELHYKRVINKKSD